MLSVSGRNAVFDEGASPTRSAARGLVPSGERRPRVLHVFWRLQRGGAELRTLEVLQALGEASPAETHILVYSGQVGELDAAFRRAGARVHHVPLTAATCAARFLRLVRDEQIDVVHSHAQYFSGWLLMLAARAGVQRRIAHLWITRNPGTLSPFRMLHRWIGKRLLGRYATRIVAVSRDVMAVAFDADWRDDPRSRVIYGGIPAPRYSTAELHAARAQARAELGFASDAIVVSHAGRFDPAKNHDRVADVFASFARRTSAARLLVIGGGNHALERSFREKIAQLGVAPAVTFAGIRADVPRLLAAADVLLFPSTREGLPGVVLEALSVGTPVVASAIAGTREIAEYSSALDLLDLTEDDAVWASRIARAVTDRSIDMRMQRVLEFSFTPFGAAAFTAALAAEWSTS